MITGKILRIVTLVLFIAISLPASANSITAGSPKTEDPKAQQLIQRLYEIKAINKSELTSEEKKNLRMEVKEIKKEMKAISGGIYLSVGAIIIVILLLILLL